MYSNESKDQYKANACHPTYSILSYPLLNHKIEKVVLTRLRLSTSIKNHFGAGPEVYIEKLVHLGKKWEENWYNETFTLFQTDLSAILLSLSHTNIRSCLPYRCVHAASTTGFFQKILL